jgi:hypothetical protein
MLFVAAMSALLPKMSPFFNLPYPCPYCTLVEALRFGPRFSCEAGRPGTVAHDALQTL